MIHKPKWMYMVDLRLELSNTWFSLKRSKDDLHVAGLHSKISLLRSEDKGPCDSGGGVEDSIASRQKDAQKWISDWKSATGASDNGASGSGSEAVDDVKSDIANRKKDAQKWISDWNSSTGGKWDLLLSDFHENGHQHNFWDWNSAGWQTKILEAQWFGYCEDCWLLTPVLFSSSSFLFMSFGIGYIGHSISLISWSKHACTAFLYALLQFCRTWILIRIIRLEEG